MHARFAALAFGLVSCATSPARDNSHDAPIPARAPSTATVDTAPSAPSDAAPRIVDVGASASLVRGSGACTRDYNERSYDDTRRAFECPGANAFDHCGGTAANCGAYRVLAEDLGVVIVVRYYDAKGILVGKTSHSMEWPGAPAALEGNVPACQITAGQKTCVEGAKSLK